MSINAILLDVGHVVQTQTVGEWSVQQVWCSANVRPELTPQTLPELGDNYSITSSTISGQSLIPGTNALVCKKITESSYFGDDHTVGTLYSVYYDTINDRVNVDPTDDEDTVVMSINSGTETSSYTFDPSVKDEPTMYVFYKGAWVDLKSPLPIIMTVPTIAVATTKRYRNTTPIQIIDIGALAGHINNGTMWGQGIGNILYTGINAQPLQEVVGDDVAITWNVTHNYMIRYVPGVTTYSWNYVPYKGQYVKMSTSASDAGLIGLYDTATIPDDIT